MRPTSVLVGLYPRAVRDRWGPELEDQARADGWRGWPDLVSGLIGLWLHPTIWPAESRALRRTRAANLTVAVTGAGWLTGHALLELSASVPRTLAHSWILNLCDTITFLGFLLVLPFPHPRTWLTLATTATRRLAIPLLLAAGVVLAVDRQAPVPQLLLLACWWLALILGMIQTVRAVATIGPAPGPRRLRTGLWLAVIGLTSSASVLLAATLSTRSDTAAGVIAGAGLLGLALAGGGTIRDLSTIA